MSKQEIRFIIDDNNFSDDEKIQILQEQGMELEDIFSFILNNYK